ncbi:Alpha/Beta hydrolase protein [Lipomyces kononenkoae]
MPRLAPRYMRPQTAEDELICRKYIGRAKTKEGGWVNASLFQSFLEPEHDLRSQAKQITVPTLLVWGVRDIIVPLDAGQYAHKLIPGSKLELFETGHVVFSSMPAEFLRVFEHFIEATSRKSENDL